MAFTYQICSDPLPSQIEEKPSKIRATQYYQSRQALLSCLNEFGLELSDWREIQIEGHLYLKGHPHFLTSLTHTKGVAGAILGIKSDKLLSVGIDIEWAERQIKEGAEKFYINDQDDTSSYSSLELWSLKESAFKAISPLLNDWPYKRFVLKHIWIKDNNYGLIQRPSLGKVSLEKKTIQKRELLCSLAQLETLPK